MNNIRFYRPQATGPQTSVQRIDHVPTNRADLAEMTETSRFETTVREHEVDKTPCSMCLSQPNVEASKMGTTKGQFQRFIRCPL